MKEQLREEIKLLWVRVQKLRKANGHSLPAEDRMARFAAILKDLEVADAAARYTGDPHFSMPTGPMGRP